MKRHRRNCGLPGLVLGLGLAACLPLVAGASAASSQETPVVLALDSSRSLSAGQSRALATLAGEILAKLPASARPGVLVFDDTARWLARPGSPGASAALGALTPSGRYTVLNDGLIEGVRALEGGGVLVLLSDGRDEDSATTLEDVARLAGERGVRLVTVGAGRADERTLRRLALLTAGLYAGHADKVNPAALGRGIEALRSEVAAVLAARAPNPAGSDRPANPAPAPAAEPGAPSSRGAVREGERPPTDRWLLPVGAAVAAIGIVVGFLLARRRGAAGAGDAAEPDRGTKPGVEWPAPLPAPVAPPAASPPPAAVPRTAPPQLDEIQIARVRLRAAVRPQGLLEISLDDTAQFQRLPFSESIERTLVLTAEVVLTVREPGRDPHSYRLPPDRAVDIGRDAATNTLAFHDPTMSTQHLRVTLDEEEIYLVDLGSTNGVLLGERRVDAVRLHPGDRFRAGMIEFEIGLHHASMT